MRENGEEMAEKTQVAGFPAGDFFWRTKEEDDAREALSVASQARGGAWPILKFF